MSKSSNNMLPLSGVKIGNIGLRYGLFLAPMAGYSDAGMRRVCREAGAEYLTSEMVSAKAVCFGDRKSLALARIREWESPCAVQIFGSEPDIMARAAERLSAGCDGGIPPCAIDINMGCPVPKVFGNGEGSSLMRDPELIYRIVRAVSGAIPVPCTVKIRLGVDEGHLNAPDCARAAEAGGAAAVFVHGRTRKQMYSGDASPEGIGEVVRAVKIPVIANGDIRDVASAAHMLSVSGAAALMIGRGAVGNPFIFSELIAAAEGKEYTPPPLDVREETAMRQLGYSVAEHGEERAVSEGRKQLGSYFHGIPGAAAFRARLNSAVSVADVAAAMRECLHEANDAELPANLQ